MSELSEAVESLVGPACCGACSSIYRSTFETKDSWSVPQTTRMVQSLYNRSSRLGRIPPRETVIVMFK